MLISFFTPSSYELDANASRSRARFFYRSAKEILDPVARQTHLSAPSSIHSIAQPITLLFAPKPATWKEKTAAKLLLSK
jgi:hypothetical protein